jgi:uncharacterized protein YhhL (DUF1145 family)
MNYWTTTLIKFLVIGIGIAIGFAREKKLNRTNYNFLIFLVVAAGGELLDWLMAYYYKHNFVYYHVFRPLFYTLITLALAEELGRMKRSFRLSILFVWIAAYFNAKYLQPPDDSLNTVIISLTCLLHILQVLFYIARLFDQYNWNETIFRHSFWIAIGILLHSIISFLTLGLHNVLGGDGQKLVTNFLIVSEWLFYASFAINMLVQKPAQAE